MFVRLAASSGLCQQQMFRFFQCFNRQGAGNCGESFQEVLQGVAAFQVIEKRLNGHPRSSEDGGPCIVSGSRAMTLDITLLLLKLRLHGKKLEQFPSLARPISEKLCFWYPINEGFRL
jgi:hypothetical protein